MTEEQYLIEINFDAIGNVQSSPALAQQVAQRATQRATASGDMLSLFLMAKVMSRGRGGISGSSRGTGAGAGRATKAPSSYLQGSAKKLSNARKIQVFNERSVLKTNYEKELERSNGQLQKEFADQEIKTEELGKKLSDITADKVKRGLETTHGYSPSDVIRGRENVGALSERNIGAPAHVKKEATIREKALPIQGTSGGTSRQFVNKDVTISEKAFLRLTELSINDTRAKNIASSNGPELTAILKSDLSIVTDKKIFVSATELKETIRHNEKLGPPGK